MGTWELIKIITEINQCYHNGMNGHMQGHSELLASSRNLHEKCSKIENPPQMSLHVFHVIMKADLSDIGFVSSEHNQ